MIPGLLLAAGTSSRMGRAKQLLDWRGQPLVRHVAQQALATTLDGLVVVVGHEAAAVRAALAGLPVTFADNPAYAEGQASSLRAGLAALPSQTEAVVVLLCDQPLVTPELIDLVVHAFRQTGGDARREIEGERDTSSLDTHHSSSPIAVIPRYQGQRGNPVLLAREVFAELTQLRGDEGARGVLGRYGERVHWLNLNDPGAITDVDTLEQYQALRASE